MKEKIKLGYIGLGRRGMAVLRQNIVFMKDVEVRMISDFSESRMNEAAALIKENMGTEPIMTKEYRDIINDSEIDAIFIMSGWNGRPEMAIECMKAGKYTAIEVGCAESLDVCLG